ncbi:unnamed protein product [Trichobilharzia szidati]|nr:unnamed protein product [Trichobilharzia szidati]
MIRIRYHCNEFIIPSVYMIHNHYCTRDYLMKDARARKLDESELSIVKPMLSVSSDPEKVIDYVAERFQKRMTYNDLRNIRATVVEDCDLQSVVFSRLHQAGKLVIIRGENDGRIKIACFSSNRQIEIYHKFPEVVSFDSTYNTNRGNYKLFQFVVTDSHGKGLPVMFAWSRQERLDDLTTILDKFKCVMGTTSNTETFVMDCAKALRGAVETTHPLCNIILCAFHVSRAMRKKTKSRLVRQYLSSMIREESIHGFYTYLGLIRHLDPRFARYVHRHWLPLKKLWAAAFNRSVLSLGNNTNNRVESLHRWMKRNLSRSITLHKCMWEVYRWSDRRLRRIDGERDVNIRVLDNRIPGLQPLLSKLTEYAGKKVIADFRRVRRARIENRISHNVFFVDGFTHPIVDMARGTCTCSVFTTCKYPCRHMVIAHLTYPHFEEENETKFGLSLNFDGDLNGGFTI